MPKPLRYDPDNDFYTVLGVPPTATLDEIHRAYRQRAKVVHPDLNRDRREWAHDQFQRLNMAHDILGDLTLRSEYNQKRQLYIETHRPGYKSAALAEASRAAWARRQRRRPPALYYLSVGILMFGALPILYYILVALITGANHQSTEVLDAAPPRPAAIVSPVIFATATSSPSSSCTDPRVMITEPHDGDNVQTPFAIRGTAFSDRFINYSVNYGSADLVKRAGGYAPIFLYSQPRLPVKSGTLVPDWVTSKLADLHGDVVLQLMMVADNYKTELTCKIAIHLNTNNASTAAATDTNS